MCNNYLQKLFPLFSSILTPSNGNFFHQLSRPPYAAKIAKLLDLFRLMAPRENTEILEQPRLFEAPIKLISKESLMNYRQSVFLLTHASKKSFQKHIADENCIFMISHIFLNLYRCVDCIRW